MERVTSTRDLLIQMEQFADARAFYEDVLGSQILQDDPALCGFETGAFRLFIGPARPWVRS